MSKPLLIGDECKFIGNYGSIIHLRRNNIRLEYREPDFIYNKDEDTYIKVFTDTTVDIVSYKDFISESKSFSYGGPADKIFAWLITSSTSFQIFSDEIFEKSVLKDDEWIRNDDRKLSIKNVAGDIGITLESYFK